MVKQQNTHQENLLNPLNPGSQLKLKNQGNQRNQSNPVLEKIRVLEKKSHRTNNSFPTA